MNKSKTSTESPKLISRFLRWFCPEYLLEEIEGDLLQFYDQDLKKYSRRSANRRLLWNTLLFFRPGIILRNKLKPLLNHNIMIRNNFKIAYRNLLSHKSNSLINIMGLVIGVAATIVIATIIRYELSFDQDHTYSSNIYRIVRVSQVEGQEEYRNNVVYPLASAMKQHVPAITGITSLMYWNWSGIQVDVLKAGNESRDMYQENNGFVFVEPAFFKLFDFSDSDFRWIHGNAEKALSEPKNIVLTKSLAIKYFGETDVVGRIIQVDRDWECKITGVIEDLPSNTDFPFKLFISYITLKQDIGDRFNSWTSISNNQSYLMLPPGVSKEEMESKMAEVHANNTIKEISDMRKYKLQPLSEVHKDARFGNFNGRVVSMERIWTFGIIGAFLLLSACINYVNLATAQSVLRSKEIGIRKVLGSLRSQLIIQFLIEAFLMALISALLGWLLAALSLPFLQGLISETTQFELITDGFNFQLVAAIIAVITMLAGFYPALVISGFSPIKAIKNKLNSAGSGIQLRKVLVVLQFCITQVFIICTFIVLSQMHHTNDRALGFEKEAILNVELQNNGTKKLGTFKNLLLDHPSIASVSFSSTMPSGFKRPGSFYDISRAHADDQEALVFERMVVDTAFLNLYGIPIVAGRGFLAADSINKMILNQTLIKKLGFKSDQEAIGQLVKLGRDQQIEIIGVMADFHSQSLRSNLDKVALQMRERDYSVINIKFKKPTDSDDYSYYQKNLFHVEDSWSNVYPSSAISYQFFDENIASFYKEETRFTKLMLIFSSIVLLIGCLGLYGLIIFVINRKMKEVAIRKVFGATLMNIVSLLSREHVMLIIISFFIAAPFAYYFMDIWLSDFVFHIEISMWLLIIPALIVLIIAMIAVSGQSIRAANLDPTATLKSE